MKSGQNQLYSKKAGNYFFWIFVVIYTLLLLYTAKKINISEDETYALNTSSRNLAGVINQSYNFEFQLPGYFVLLSLWRLISSSIFFAKLFSIASIGIASFYTYKLSNLFTGKKNSRWIIVLFLLNPFSVWASLEIRLYAFSVLLATLCIYFFYKYVFKENKKDLFLFLLFALTGIYTQYFFVFLIIALALTTIFIKGWRYFFNTCLTLVPLAILFLPNFIFIPNQLKMQTAHGKSSINLGTVSAVLHAPQNLMLAIDYVPDPAKNRIIRFIFLAMLIGTCFYVYKNKAKMTFAFGSFKIVLAALSFLIIIFSIAGFLTNIVFTSKYMVVAYPFFILLISLFNLLPPFFRSVSFGIICMYFTLLLAVFYRYPVNTYDFNSIARYIEKIEKPNEPILMYRANNALPFNYSYKGINKIVPLPHPVNFDSNYLVSIKDTNELRQLLSDIKPQSGSYLMISDTTKFETTLDMHRQMVKDFLYKNYKVTLDTLFEGNAKGKTLRIRQFELKN